MQLHPHGFLSNMLCLRAISPALFQEIRETGDMNDTEAGEMLILPHSSSAPGVCGDSFFGLSSQGEASVARIDRASGPELLIEAQVAARELADDPTALQKEVFSRLIELSGRLQELGGEDGFVRVRRDGDKVYLERAEERVLVGAVAPSA